jgi:hypothetical protein
MVINNPYYIQTEIKKPTETVYELKDQVPSFEEFMKTYQADENLNYDDLSGGSVSEIKGYGPCYSVNKNCICYVNRSPKWIQLYMRCPGINEGNTCKNPDYSSWVHASCDYPIYISTDLDIKCIMCDRPSHMTNWKFNCYDYRHPGDFIGTNYTIFLSAVSLINVELGSRDVGIQDAIRAITMKLFDKIRNG